MTVSPQVQLALAARHVVDGRHAEAGEALQQVLASDPGHAGALIQSSYLESLQGRYRSARDFALRASRSPRPSEEDLCELMARLRTFNEAEALLALLQRIGPPSRMSIRLLLAAAAQLSYLNLQSHALDHLDEAYRADPDYPPTLVSRGQVLTYLGRFDEAEASLRRCLRKAPALANAWWALSRLPRTGPGLSADIEAMRRELPRPGRQAQDGALLVLALHADLDRAGAYAEAGRALLAGCRAKRGTLRYSSVAFEQWVDQLLDSTRGWAAPAADADGPVPIFIVGMHRSGTTLLEQLIAGHPRVHGIGELYDFTTRMRHATDHHCRGVIDLETVRRATFPDLDFGAIGRGYVDGLRWRIGEATHFTDKLPTNFLQLGHIARALPQARFLHMRRDPRETCFSNLREAFSDANPHSYDLREMAHYHRQYQRIMQHWHALMPGRILDVDYLALTGDTAATMQAVAAFCGLRFDSAMLDIGPGRGVATASAVQVRGGIRAAAGKWRPYADLLAPMLEQLEQDQAASP